MRELTYTSPCKFNLYLDVIGRRPNGYHDVVTIMEPIYLNDTLVLRDAPRGIKVTTNHPGVPSGPENIVFQAVKILKKLSGARKGIWIHIEKKVPVAGGLGGGSANAASTLKKLNQFWGLELPEESLAKLARQLGSDVPFFLNPHTSLCWGRGEKIDPLPPAPPLWVVLINPGFPLPTRWAYSQIDRKGFGSHPQAHLNRILQSLNKGNLKAIGRSIYNIFQNVVAQQRPQVKILLNFFRSQDVVGTILAGSGPTVVAMVEREEQARELAGQAESVFPSHYNIVIASNIPDS